MICSVSKLSGTSGSSRIGRALGNSPRSATVRVSTPKSRAMAVSTRMQTSGEGMARVSRGKV
ncbi:hypothetical protein D3C86_2225650 [compost metagenome]